LGLALLGCQEKAYRSFDEVSQPQQLWSARRTDVGRLRAHPLVSREVAIHG